MGTAYGQYFVLVSKIYPTVSYERDHSFAHLMPDWEGGGFHDFSTANGCNMIPLCFFVRSIEHST